MASKYPGKHGTVMEAGDRSHEQLKKSLKFALRMNEATTLVTSFLSFHQMPGY